MKEHYKMLCFTNLENNKCVEACSYHNEPFKIPVAVKEIINLMDGMDNIFTQK